MAVEVKDDGRGQSSKMAVEVKDGSRCQSSKMAVEKKSTEEDGFLHRFIDLMFLHKNDEDKFEYLNISQEIIGLKLKLAMIFVICICFHSLRVRNGKSSGNLPSRNSTATIGVFWGHGLYGSPDLLFTDEEEQMKNR
ncbi:hypothetical protein LOTGIDRAFT_173736 [Lottia gigantea]|uniref:Uncharacterized protein n=1 Tax=Lottia gigantea TaxID=225164 RepID=V4AQS2_LOTGI|nr:hypothetical protein LOTGIDRAFT_173736 [Lottia gigantea]ESO99592.1 hypothetical protein LOTGIDRAFT_173736 [Lottia gigantea]